MRKKQTLWTWFFATLLIFIGVNIYLFVTAGTHPNILDGTMPFGFPIPWGTYGGFVTTTNIFWPGILLNILVAALVGLAVGWTATKFFNPK